jgi:tryptophanyl-tRNA synthetase
MAADILLYKTTHVPVGEDQKQHLELAREIASTFNHRYGQEFFVTPEPYIMGEATRVMSFRDGSKKMSKSDPSDLSRINFIDDADTIAKKIRKAKTDSEPLPETMAELENRPEAKNLVIIYAALSGQKSDEVLAEFSGKQFSEFKPALIDVAVTHLSPITYRMSELMQDVYEIDNILRKGAEKANEIAEPVISEAMNIMGFLKV